MRISYVVYILAGEGTSMLCDMLFRVTWLHMVCGASVRWFVSGGIVPSLYTVSRRVWSVVQGMPGSQWRPGLVYPAQQTIHVVGCAE